MPGYAISSWFGFFGPAGLPRPIVQKLNSVINVVLRLPATRETLEKSGMTASGGSPDELGQLLRDELSVRGKLVKAAGLEPE